MTTGKISLLVIILILCVPLAYLASVYHSLPTIVPLHFGANGKPDSFGDKKQLVWTISIVTAIVFGSYMLLTNIHKIDPKKSAKYSAESMNKIAFAIVLFLSAINIVIVYSTVHAEVNITKLLLPLMGLFFAYLGNVMYSVKPNYFVGIRTPWTLENEDNWRRTHQLAGKLWFGGGLLIALGTLLLNAEVSFIYFISIVAFIALVPVAYSFIIFKKMKSSHE